MFPRQQGRASVHPRTRILARYVITMQPELVLGRKKSKFLVEGGGRHFPEGEVHTGTHNNEVFVAEAQGEAHSKESVARLSWVIPTV